MLRIDEDWLTRAATQRLFRALETAGYQAYAVGGCVRDSLLRRPVNDIDFATSARPVDVLSVAKEHGFHAVPTGIDHGTVTIVIDDVPHEVTTFRRDVATDGRRATIAFADSILEDACRRDFTMNALYVDRQGNVLDPIGGLTDLKSRRIRFIENASERIREDYLRSLRFFRFHAWYGDPKIGFDTDAMAAIAENLAGIATLSRERIGAEILKLLGADNPAPAVAGMRSTGVLGMILPGSEDYAVAPLVHLEAELGVTPDAMRRLAVLGGKHLRSRLRLSRKQTEKLKAIRSATELTGEEAGYRYGWEIVRDAILVRAATLGTPVDLKELQSAQAAATRVFPLSAADLMPGLQGPALGAALKDLEQHWIDSHFQLKLSELLALASKDR